ncbi:aggregation-promoting factor C-terminal-like domain-containing protein [Enterococcus raffinosus]|uniref:Phage tail tape measure protein n=2 Tax=Enterococcus raffinosus TaxID=71452 RepID=A0AAW8THQ8_9ENTE|nr:phage tail tape measure protein [Enterococcus raffinosus]MDT2536170.1 phage tail tape measure protein [Enterococcus raffinosus]MDT2546652.1 phage tail tape measure protein [Enterococcus raffinosus]MDT2579966.1 phage tail tape measure protein [Enterococcus raffinosus]MDT2592930.1 phage tail tape measure protein [Enterococcus raffinosus]
MGADATINIDVMLANLPKFKNDVSLVDELLAKLGMNAGSKMDESFKSETTKIESIAKSTKKDIDQSLDKPVKFTIKADNSEAEKGVKETKAFLKDIPKSKITELKADNDGASLKIKALKSDISAIPNQKETTLKADATQAKTETKELGDTVEKTGSKFVGLKEIIAGTFIGNAFSKGVESVGSAFKETFGRVIELNDASVEFKNTMGISQEQSKKYETALNDLFNSGLIETMDEGKEILKTINTQLGDMPIDQLKKVSEYSAILQSQFGMDLNESLRGINSLMTNFGLTAEDSFDYMVKGAQSGLDKTDELGDNLAEYGQLWSQAGFKADEMFAILDNGLKSGAYNLDKVNDFVKEFSISLNDGRIEDNLDKFSGKTQEIFHAFKNGQATSNDVFKSVISDLKGTTNEQEKLSLASTVWSALGEDNAMKVIESLGDVNDTFDDVGGAAEDARKEMEESFGVRVRQAIRDVTGSLNPIGEKLMDIVEKYLPDLKKTAKDTFGSAVKYISDLFTYIDKNRSTIGNIAGNVKDLAKALVSGAWEQGKDILLAVADMFGLIDDNTKKIKDPLKQLDKIIENLADNKDKVELLGKALVTMFAVKKGFEFISMIKDAKKHLLEFTAIEKATSFLSGGLGNTTKAGVTQTVTETAATVAPAAVGGTGIAAKLGSLVTGLAKLTPVISVLASVPELFKKGSTGEKTGGFLGGIGGGLGGAKLGATIGTMIAPGIGTAIGTVLGGAAGQFAGSKFGSGFVGSLQESLNGKPLKPKVKKTKAKIEIEIDEKKINKKIAPEIKKLNKALLVDMGIDPKSTKKAKKESDKLFEEMGKDIDGYYKKKQKQSKKDLDLLVKQGVMTREEADKLLKKEQKNNDAKKDALIKMQTTVNEYYKKVEDIQNDSSKSEKQKNKELNKLRKQFVKDYVADQFAMNGKAVEAIENGAKEQEDLLKQLRKKKGKLSAKDIEATQEEADKLYEASVKPAKKTRDDVINAADKKYKETVKAAKRQRDETGTLSQEQYEKVVKEARKQRDDTHTAAKNQYKEVTAKAKEQHDKVSDEITKQKTAVVTLANDQAREHIGASQNETGTVQGSWDGLKSNLSSILEAIAHGIGKLIGGLNKDWGKGLRDFKFPAHAKGTSGLPEDEIALVGEEGFEMAHHPSKGIFAVGVNGPEIRPLQAGTSILPHEASKQFLSMTRGLPAHASGVWGTINNIADWVKEKAENVEDFVFDGADKLYNTVTDKLGISKFLDSLGDSAEFKVAKGGLNTVKDSVIKYAQSLFDQYQEEFGASGSFDGAMNANGVYDYLVKVAQKVIGKFGSGFYVSSGYRPGDQYHHGQHQAIDIAIPGAILSPLYTKAANYAFEKFPKEVGYVITNGMVRDRMGYTHGGTSGKWVPWGSTDHDNHVHISGRMGSGDIYHGNTNSGGTNAKPTGGHQNWMKQAGFSPSEYAAIDYIVNHESSWNPQAVNASSGAYGLPQSLPASKLASAGSDWRTNPITQLKWMRNYVNERYGGANGALSFWKANHWYANGGEVDKPTLAWIGEDPNYAKEFIINPAKDSADLLIQKAIAAREQYKPTPSAQGYSSNDNSTGRFVTQTDLNQLINKINERPVKVNSILDGKQVGHSVDQTNAGTLKRKLYTARRA